MGMQTFLSDTPSTYWSVSGMTQTYLVPGVSCEHCRRAIADEVSQVPGVVAVDVDLEAKRVRVDGDGDPDAVRAAIEEAGYDIAS
jgi:copper chaperone